MKQFLITLAGVFAGLILFFVGLPFLLIVMAAGASRPAPPPARTVLEIDLRQGIADQEPANPFAGFGVSRPLSVMSIVQTLHRAEQDDRVKALLVRVPEGGLPPAAADEIRGALKAFRASGKRVIAHSQGIYPFGVSSAAYMVGAAADEFWMQPNSSLQVTGVNVEDTFLKRAFDKYGLQADYQQRYEYKNAVNQYLYSDYTPAHREAELGWMTSIYTSELAAAAADRKMPFQILRATLEAGPWGAEDAKARRLIDRTGQAEEAAAALQRAAGDDAKLVDFAEYKASVLRGARSGGGGPAIAVIQAEGAIETGSDKHSGGFGSSSGIKSDDVAKAFYDAAKDDAVKAIVFRVSSPGGSDTASEQILAGVRAAKAAGKPVVVSMGTYAASGGYWISSEASEIVAQPTTLTGSIGVFGGKFVIGPALARFGIDLRDLTVGGTYASAFNSAEPFTPAQRAQVSNWMDRIYAGFVDRVARGRRLSHDQVRQIAKGRVWTGEQAVRLGLVDKLGGYDLALREAKAKAGLDPSKAVTIKRYPGPESAVEALRRALGVSSASVKTLAAAAWVMGDPRAQTILDTLAETRMRSEGRAAALAPTPRF